MNCHGQLRTDRLSYRSGERARALLTNTGGLNDSGPILWAAAALVLLAGAIRYAQQPSFWLDEAFVAVSLLEPSPVRIFAPLEYGQYFPRIYLSAIALLREVSGYHIWSLRLLPFLSFAGGTILWARLLGKRSGPLLVTGLMSAGFLIGANFWLDQAVQLKQYTFDVLLSLVPFILDDTFFEKPLAEGRRKASLILLALPCLLSYTYPIALGARLLGWYLYHGPSRGWRLNIPALSTLAASVALTLAGIWLTDLRYNLKDMAAYQAYWSDCIVGVRMKEDFGSALRLIFKFLWKWHGRMPLVTAGIVPLQMLGLYSVIRHRRGRDGSAGSSSWGARSLGSITLLAGVILASALVNYPICAPRVVLFTQVHTQVLAMEGALLVLSAWGARKAARYSLYIFIAVLLFHSGRSYLQFVSSEPEENLRPMLALIKPEVSDTLWVQPCSVAQVKTLPDPLPVQQVFYGSEKDLPRGKKTWIIWSQMGEEGCRTQFQ
ncbi:MAG TPA: hypothetical protein VNH22_16420, partial [Blastocatellia bacterium]|nr:hypothetical protein [Blastocatellia bacterium]